MQFEPREADLHASGGAKKARDSSEAKPLC